MLIYIDTDSGTWGVGESNIVFLDVTNEQADRLMEMSDSDIIAFGKNGVPDCGNPGPDCVEHDGMCD